MYHSFDEKIWFPIIFSLLKGVELCIRLVFLNILMENYDHINCPGLMILFLYVPVHNEFILVLYWILVQPT